jgi:pimeloyl-ACP methyl ester carboxylesterase
MVKRLIGTSARPGVVEESVHLLAALHVSSYLKTITASVEEDRAAPLEALAMPVLVIASDQDPLYGPELGRDMAARIPRAEFVVIAPAGHLSNLEQPEQFNDKVLTFLRKNSGSPCAGGHRPASAWSDH